MSIPNAATFVAKDSRIAFLDELASTFQSSILPYIEDEREQAFGREALRYYRRSYDRIHDNAAFQGRMKQIFSGLLRFENASALVEVLK